MLQYTDKCCSVSQLSTLGVHPVYAAVPWQMRFVGWEDCKCDCFSLTPPHRQTHSVFGGFCPVFLMTYCFLVSEGERICHLKLVAIKVGKHEGSFISCNQFVLNVSIAVSFWCFSVLRSNGGHTSSYLLIVLLQEKPVNKSMITSSSYRKRNKI